MFNENKDFPRIGKSVQLFEKYFGEQLNRSENLVEFAQDIYDNGEYVKVLKVNEKANNIAWTIESKSHVAVLAADKFLPDDTKLVKEQIAVKNIFIDAEFPVDIYEYYSESLLDSDAYIKSDQSDKGYITVYISEINNVNCRLVVGLGREDQVN